MQISTFISHFKSYRKFLAVLIAFLAVIFIYVWYCSYESWTKWPTHTLFYDPLATAFADGSLALEEKVDPSILLLTNPYDPGERKRKGLDFPMDYSLYDGKYYLYFGPIPALPLVLLKFFGVGTIGDQYLVFAGITGLFIFQSLLIIYIRRRFFSSIPFWTIPICIFFAGLILPLPRMLTDGRVYETAVAGGQCFFLAGLYFIVTTLSEKNRLAWRFVMVGVFWALALGTRITQILPIGFIAFMLIVLSIRVFHQTKSFSRAVCPVVMVGFPLALGIIALGWYNWARFGDIFETGISYQLTTPNLQKYRQVLFSPLYILPNMHNYLTAPPKVNEVFPFLQSIRGRGNLLFPFIELPKVYYTRSMTGILFSAPFVIFAGLSVLPILFPKIGRKGSLDNLDNDHQMLKWVLISLWGAFLTSFVLILSYFWVEIRFSTDFMPSLALLSIIGFWTSYQSLVHRSVARKLFMAVGVSFMLVSIISSNLLLFSNQASVYQVLFPDLWDLLSNVSSRLIELIRP